MSISITDIAKQLGLSPTTVSWVLSGQGDRRRIGKATQDKIMEFAKGHNYSPNLLARSLNKGRSDTIGLVLPSISDSFYSRITKAIEHESQSLGYTLMICDSESLLEVENRMIDTFRSKMVDGLIIAPTKYSDAKILELKRENFPFVLFDRHFPEIDTNWIVLDNEKTSHDLVEELIGEGFSNIGIILTNPHLDVMKERHAGYARALREHGIEPDPALYGEVPFQDYEKNIGTVLETMLNSGRKLDAIYFGTHILALDSFAWLKTHNIPISSVGFACIHEAKGLTFMAPHMKVARVHTGEIGRQAVRILDRQIRAHREDLPFTCEHIVESCDIL